MEVFFFFVFVWLFICCLDAPDVFFVPEAGDFRIALEDAGARFFEAVLPLFLRGLASTSKLVSLPCPYAMPSNHSMHPVVPIFPQYIPIIRKAPASINPFGLIWQAYISTF